MRSCISSTRIYLVYASEDFVGLLFLKALLMVKTLLDIFVNKSRKDPVAVLKLIWAKDLVGEAHIGSTTINPITDTS